jgi:hypothetical protein
MVANLFIFLLNCFGCPREECCKEVSSNIFRFQKEVTVPDTAVLSLIFKSKVSQLAFLNSGLF